VTGSTRRLYGLPTGARAAEEPDPSVNSPDGFLDLFGRSPRQSSCECERFTGVMLGQALNLINGPTVAGAIDEPNNSLSQLVAAQKDDGRLIDEIFMRVLNRPPKPTEIAASTQTLRSFDDDHGKLVAQLAEYEKTLPAKESEWEKTAEQAVAWVPLEVQTAKSAIGGTLTKEPNDVIFAAGKIEKDAYTLTVKTDLRGITAFRLEALADPRLPKSGPGRAPNGNQVLSEFRVTAAPAADPSKAQPVVLQNAQADYNQPGWHVTGAIDGDPSTGWAIDQQEGHDHVALFECHQDIGFSGGTLLTFTLDQQYPDGHHLLGKFRLSASTSKRPIRLQGEPSNVTRLLAIPPEKRSAAEQAELMQHYRSLDPELTRLSLAVAQHANDRVNARLLGAQDLVWALINSPAFLFNH
jgi:hypothetical protein